MDSNSPDWEISKLYTRAFEVVKKNKLLWVLGLAAAGGGFNFRSGSNFGSDSFDKIFPNSTPVPGTQPPPESFNNVLGAATSSPFLESIKNIFSSVPFYFYLLLGLEFLTLIVLSLIINIIYSAWSEGLLIQSSMDGAENKKVAIESASQKVFGKLKPLIWLQIVPGLIFTLVVIITIVVLSILFAILPGAAKAIPGILTLIAIGAGIYWALHLALIQIWAPRQVLFENKKSREAFFSGLKLSRKKFWASILLAFVNNILAIFVIGIPIAVLFGLGVGGFFVGKLTPALGILLALIAVPVFLAALVGFMLLSGALNSFKATVWTLAYQQIKGKYD